MQHRDTRGDKPTHKAGEKNPVYNENRFATISLRNNNLYSANVDSGFVDRT